MEKEKPDQPALSKEEKRKRYLEMEEEGDKRAVEEAREIIPLVQRDGKLRYLKSTGGYLRIGRHRDGRIFVCGHNNSENLLRQANRIAKETGIVVDEW